MDCSPSVSSVRGISQVKILERVAISLSRRASQPRDQTHVSCISRLVLYHWATREACAGLLLLFRNAPLYLFIFYFSLLFFNHLSFIYYYYYFFLLYNIYSIGFAIYQHEIIDIETRLVDASVWGDVGVVGRWMWL